MAVTIMIKLCSREEGGATEDRTCLWTYYVFEIITIFCATLKMAVLMIKTIGKLVFTTVYTLH